MRTEELELPATTEIESNTVSYGKPANWQIVQVLSSDQKATVVELLLLQESNAPLVIEQPKDDLNDRFNNDGMVQIMQEENHCRQFVLSTHNTYILVLDDDELILQFTEQGECRKGQSQITPTYMSLINFSSVRELIGEILECVMVVFEIRCSKYGF